jgi:hypothetical protein
MQVEGVISVPRLSIIVPHISDEASLETTILSVLENRPQGSELLVVHNGDYHDPYELDDDEIRLIEAPDGSELVEQLNIATREAFGNVLHTLLPGCCVEANWTAPAMAWFQDAAVGTVSPSVTALAGKGSSYAGLAPHCLPRRAWCSRIRRGEDAVASMCGGFYRRQTVQALDGWMPSSQREGAEAEMALAMHILSMRCIAEPESKIFAPKNVIEGQVGGYALGNYAGKLAIAYSQLSPSSLASNSIAARIGHLAGGLISPTSVAERLGWVLGVADRSLVEEVRERIEQAEASSSRHRIKPSNDYQDSRRAA